MDSRERVQRSSAGAVMSQKSPILRTPRHTKGLGVGAGIYGIGFGFESRFLSVCGIGALPSRQKANSLLALVPLDLLLKPLKVPELDGRTSFGRQWPQWPPEAGFVLQPAP